MQNKNIEQNPLEYIERGMDKIENNPLIHFLLTGTIFYAIILATLVLSDNMIATIITSAILGFLFVGGVLLPTFGKLITIEIEKSNKTKEKKY